MERKLAKNKTGPDVRFQDLVSGLMQLELDRSRPAIVHTSLSAFGTVRGGAGTVVSALLTCFLGVIMPAFTYKTMIIPAEGPPENGIEYGRSADHNRQAVFWSADMPADRLMGSVPEALRVHRKSARSDHPILSFTGAGVVNLLARQSLDDPLGPIAALVEAGGWVVLLGVDHSVNTSLHYAEELAGRKTFTRWALTERGVVACPRFPGCSNGFVDLEPVLAPVTRSIRIGKAHIQALPAKSMVSAAELAFRKSPRGFLCKRMDCGRCNAVRRMAQS